MELLARKKDKLVAHDEKRFGKERRKGLRTEVNGERRTRQEQELQVPPRTLLNQLCKVLLQMKHLTSDHHN